jgi:hypothetical protein
LCESGDFAAGETTVNPVSLSFPTKERSRNKSIPYSFIASVYFKSGMMALLLFPNSLGAGVNSGLRPAESHQHFLYNFSVQPVFTNRDDVVSWEMLPAYLNMTIVSATVSAYKFVIPTRRNPTSIIVFYVISLVCLCSERNVRAKECLLLWAGKYISVLSRLKKFVCGAIRFSNHYPKI